MFKNFIDFQKQFSTELKCIKYLENLRWNNKPTCPHCLKNENTCFYKKVGLYACSKCRKQFTIRKGTIFEDSALPLVKWFQAFYYEISNIKAMSSYNLKDKIGTTQRTAWFVQQRIRWALKNNTIEKFKGDVEVDETYLGGKEGNKHKSKKNENQTLDNKMAVLGVLKRGGKMLTMKYINKTNIKNIKPILDKHIDLANCTLFTDESALYKGYERKTTNHSQGEYVKEEAHTNGIEGTFGLFKRRIYGIHHQITRQHIEKYISSFMFYFNNKSFEIAERFENAMMSMFSNNNLTYKILTGKEMDLRMCMRRI